MFSIVPVCSKVEKTQRGESLLHLHLRQKLHGLEPLLTSLTCADATVDADGTWLRNSSQGP